MPGAISIFVEGDFATLTVFWRGASGHENSLFECLDDYNSRFWSSNDDSCTLLQGRFATPFFSWCSFVKTLGLDAERANSRVEFATLTMFWRGATRSGAKWTLESVPLPPYLVRANWLPVNCSVAF